MALIYPFAYQHSDWPILRPVCNALVDRGHTIITAPINLARIVSEYGTGPRAILLCADYWHWEHTEGMAAVKLARFKGVPTISIQHGIPWPIAPVTTTADLFCLWSDFWRPLFRSNETTITGNPALDGLADYEPTTAAPEYPFAVLFSQLNHLPPEYQHLTPEDVAAETIQRVRDTGYDGTWLVRPHPSDIKYPERMELHGQVCAAIGGEMNVPADDLPLYDLLYYAEAAAGASTATLEAWAFGCEPFPLFLDSRFWPTSLDDALANRGRAASAAADVVEERLSIAYRGGNNDNKSA